MKFHAAIMSQTVTPDLPKVASLLSTVQLYLVHEGMTVAQAKAYGILALYQQVQMNAAVRSFEDCFIFAMVVCLFGIVPAFFLRVSKAARRPGEAIVME